MVLGFSVRETMQFPIGHVVSSTYLATRCRLILRRLKLNQKCVAGALNDFRPYIGSENSGNVEPNHADSAIMATGG